MWKILSRRSMRQRVWRKQFTSLYSIIIDQTPSWRSNDVSFEWLPLTGRLSMWNNDLKVVDVRRKNSRRHLFVKNRKIVQVSILLDTDCIEQQLWCVFIILCRAPLKFGSNELNWRSARVQVNWTGDQLKFCWAELVTSSRSAELNWWPAHVRMSWTSDELTFRWTWTGNTVIRFSSVSCWAWTVTGL